jgi:hypothetical protein
MISWIGYVPGGVEGGIGSPIVRAVRIRNFSHSSTPGRFSERIRGRIDASSSPLASLADVGDRALVRYAIRGGTAALLTTDLRDRSGAGVAMSIATGTEVWRPTDVLCAYQGDMPTAAA